jgi:hypothetical protein
MCAVSSVTPVAADAWVCLHDGTWMKMLEVTWPVIFSISGKKLSQKDAGLSINAMTRKAHGLFQNFHARNVFSIEVASRIEQFFFKSV